VNAVGSHLVTVVEQCIVMLANPDPLLQLLLVQLLGHLLQEPHLVVAKLLCEANGIKQLMVRRGHAFNATACTGASV
jgi:hypothetical protein